MLKTHQMLQSDACRSSWARRCSWGMSKVSWETIVLCTPFKFYRSFRHAIAAKYSEIAIWRQPIVTMLTSAVSGDVFKHARQHHSSAQIGRVRVLSGPCKRAVESLHWLLKHAHESKPCACKQKCGYSFERRIFLSRYPKERRALPVITATIACSTHNPIQGLFWSHTSFKPCIVYQLLVHLVYTCGRRLQM
jgi:hypothetical protein